MLHLTPENLAAMYECVRTFPPFSRWKLPPSDEVEFRVTKQEGIHGAHSTQQKQHVIEISAKGVGHFDTFGWVMAHEMLHLAQAVRGTSTPNTVHNAEFRRLAKKLCDQFGHDPHNFAL